MRKNKSDAIHLHAVPTTTHATVSVGEARRLDGSDLQAATQAVHHQRRERFTFDVFRDVDERLAALHQR